MVAALRMSSSLERMGDLSAHIALTARRSHPEPTVPAQHREQIARMGELAATAVHEAAVVIAERDLALAARVENNDSQLDELQREIAREIDRKSTRLNSSHVASSYAVFCLKKKTDRRRDCAGERNSRRR